MSHPFGMTSTLFAFIPRLNKSLFISSDKTTIRLEHAYAIFSNQRVRSFNIGFLIMPIAIGTSGHRSCTSKTIGHRLSLDEIIAGIHMVSGVLVAKTTSALNEIALTLAIKAKRAKLNTLIKNPIRLEYGIFA